MVKKAKNLQNSTPEKEDTNKASKNLFFDDYYDIFTLRSKPVSEAYLQQVASKLIDWSTNDDEAFKIGQFYLKAGIARSDFYRWIQKYPYMKQAHEVALEAIGNRREVGGLKKNLSETMVIKAMPFYDIDWIKESERLASLKITDSPQNETKIVVMKELFQKGETDGKA